MDKAFGGSFPNRCLFTWWWMANGGAKHHVFPMGLGSRFLGFRAYGQQNLDVNSREIASSIIACTVLLHVAIESAYLYTREQRILAQCESERTRSFGKRDPTVHGIVGFKYCLVLCLILVYEIRVKLHCMYVDPSQTDSLRPRKSAHMVMDGSWMGL